MKEKTTQQKCQKIAKELTAILPDLRVFDYKKATVLLGASMILKVLGDYGIESKKKVS